MPRFLKLLIIVAGLLAVGPGLASAAELPDHAIGQIKDLTAGTVIGRGDSRINAEMGAPVFKNDVMETDASGAVGVTFIDGTTLSLGPDSQLELDDMVYQPQEGNLSFGINFLKGTATYTSGRIAKLAPENVNLRTPVATIGIRGTRILIKVAD